MQTKPPWHGVSGDASQSSSEVHSPVHRCGVLDATWRHVRDWHSRPVPTTVTGTPPSCSEFGMKHCLPTGLSLHAPPSTEHTRRPRKKPKRCSRLALESFIRAPAGPSYLRVGGSQALAKLARSVGYGLGG